MASGVPNGGYASFEEFKAGTPTYPIDTFVIREGGVHFSSPLYHSGNKAVTIKYKREDGKVRRWRSSTNGPLWAVVTNGHVYLFPSCIELHYAKSYSWYSVVKTYTHTTGGMNGAPGHTVTTTKVEYYYMDMATGKSTKLTKRSLKRLLKKEDPELLEEYNEISFPRTKRLQYLQKFINRRVE